MPTSAELTIDLSRPSDADPGLAPPSPDRPLTLAEEAQVAQAVRTVNAILLRKNLEIAIELHRYVLDEFFGGSWQAWADNRPGRVPAYDALAADRALRVGREMLRELVRVGEQVQRMPGGIATALSVAHHRALLPVPDPDERVELAQRAVQEGLNAKQLSELVRQVHPPVARAKGRKPQPRGFRKLGAAFAASREVDPQRVAAEVAHYSEHQRKVMVERAEALRALAEAVLAALSTAPTT